jgi:phosphotransferase system enzyme I (PtsP)
VSIVARALGIAAVGQIANATGIVDPGDAIIVDGTMGHVYIRPTADVEKNYADRVRLRARRQAQYAELRDKPTVTKDGEKIALLLNAGLLVDLPHIAETGAAGIGLFRTELQFMVAHDMPRAAEQLRLYRDVLNAAGKRPVTFRTLDIGGDKVLPYLRFEDDEENPALGWRAIRLGLDHPDLLSTQIRALLDAAADRELRIMFPMVTTVGEFDQAKVLVERELTQLRRDGHTLPARVHVGVMVEVPALLYQLDELLTRVDFVSVGSNDLMQFMFAADRSNTHVSSRFDPISPPFLRALKTVADKGRAANKPVTLCGELASQPIGALALVAIGYRSMSVSASSVGPVKAMLLDLDTRKVTALINPLLDGMKQKDTLRQALEAFAQAEGLQI